MTTRETVDVVFGLDTTGSMYTVLTQARRYMAETAKYLFKNIPNIRFGFFTFGDWCDVKNGRSGAFTTLDLTSDLDAILNFIKNAPSTGGCSRGAMYERVLKEARGLSWTSGRQKALVLVADTYPHSGGAADRKGTCECGSYWSAAASHPQIDWRNEVELLREAGINVYPVRALAHQNSEADWFYDELADRAHTVKIPLDQFADINDLIMALSMKTADKLGEFESFIESRGDVSHGTIDILEHLSGRKRKRARKDYGGLIPVPRSRFQVLVVDDDTPIKDFVEENDLRFQIGRGFYEFTKSVILRPGREVIIQDRQTGDMFSGVDARSLLGLPVRQTGNERVRPDKLNQWRGFIQSTSPNRKLLANTRFLYEVDDV